MKTSKFIAAVAIIVVAMAACQKENKTKPNNMAATSQAIAPGTELKPITQKMYNVTGAEALKIVKHFKKLDVEQNQQGRLIAADSVLLDSSIFVVEAALNYDFDFNNPNPGDSYITADGIDTSEYSIVINRSTYKVNSNDLEDVYNDLYSYINSTINDSVKVRVINLEAYLVGANQVTYRAMVVNYYKKELDCAPIALNGWAGRQTNYYNPNTFWTYEEGGKIVARYLNGCTWGPCPVSSNFYTNVSSPYFSSYQNLFNANYMLYMSGLAFNGTVLTATDLNNYVNSMNTFGNLSTIKPSSSHVPLMASYTPAPYIFISSNLSTYSTFWSFNIWFGIPTNPC